MIHLTPVRAGEAQYSRLDMTPAAPPSLHPFHHYLSQTTPPIFHSPVPSNGSSDRISSTSVLHTPPTITRHHSSEWSQDIPEFVPAGFQQQQPQQLQDGNLGVGDPFASYDGSNSFSESDAAVTAAALNPYAPDAVSASGNAAFYPHASAFSQPLQHHLYAPTGPHRENLLAYQRTAHDFFIPESLRQDLQRRAEATLQVLPNSSLPASIEYFHSLVPLDTNNQRSTNSFGYNTWVYKATSTKDGYAYVLRRVEGFRLTNEKAIRSVQAWKRLSCASSVNVLDCFTTRAFGDSSLVFVTDYHPLAKSLVDQHFTSFYNPRQRSAQTLIAEQVLWSYLVQLTSALKVIHGNGLAARCISPSKVLVTDKNRVLLNCCGVLDVIQPDEASPVSKQQLEDIHSLGKLLLALATNNPNATTATPKTNDAMTRTYSDRLKKTITALLDAGPQHPISRDVNTLMTNIADQAFSVMDSALHYEDDIMSNLYRELESSRLFRLMAKLGFVNERPEYGDLQGPSQWSETGERYYLKLFRDYVFHQVNADGRPVVDLGHVLACLNKLDAGIDEKIMLTSRDEQNVFVVSYKELKRGIESAFQDLLKNARRS